MIKRIDLARVCLVGGVIGVALILPYFWLLSGIKRSAVLGVIFLTYFALCLPTLRKKFNAPDDLLFSILKVLFGVFIIGKSIRDFYDSSILNNVSIAAFETAVYFLLILIAWTSAKRVFDGKAMLVVTAWALGIAVYGGVNFVGSLAGITQETSSASSLISETRSRMQIPFGPGLNLFGIVVASGGVFALEALRNSIKERNLTLILLNASALLTNWMVVILVETRSVILPLLSYLVWNTVKAKGIRVGIAVASMAVIVFTPLLGGLTNFFPFVADLIPASVQNSMSRSADDLKEFGGRTVIWEYAFQEIKAGNIKVFGDGQLERDTRPLFHLLFRYMPESNTTYHNGFIDLFFVYGPPLGALGSLTLLLSILWSGVFNLGVHGHRRASQTAAAGLLVAISLCTILESSMTLNHFWILLAVLLALQSDSRDSQVAVVKKKAAAAVGLDGAGRAVSSTPRPSLS